MFVYTQVILRTKSQETDTGLRTPSKSPEDVSRVFRHERTTQSLIRLSHKFVSGRTVDRVYEKDNTTLGHHPVFSLVTDNSLNVLRIPFPNGL